MPSRLQSRGKLVLRARRETFLRTHRAAMRWQSNPLLPRTRFWLFLTTDDTHSRLYDPPLQNARIWESIGTRLKS